MPDDLADQAASVGALAEPARRALYLYVAAQPDPVSREQAADAVDLPLHSVKFHLDQLVERGLLDVEFRRLSGRTGPGAGRPAKLYRRSARQLSVSLPERRYDLAGDVLATAIDASRRDGVRVEKAVRDAAREAGRRMAAVLGRGLGQRQAGAADLARVADVLAAHGYEPQRVGNELCLANCPFDRMAAEHTELVCDMNLALVGGVLDALQVRDLTPRLAPQPGCCCVKIAP